MHHSVLFSKHAELCDRHPIFLSPPYTCLQFILVTTSSPQQERASVCLHRFPIPDIPREWGHTQGLVSVHLLSVSTSLRSIHTVASLGLHSLAWTTF